MLQLCFGTEREALAAAARINAIHDHVHGQLSHAAGIFPKGTPYSAHDPSLLTWVHATLLEMNLRVYELFVAPLRVEDKDRYCVEVSSIEGLFSIPEGRLPRSVSELQRYMDKMYASGEISVTDVARMLSRALLYPQVPRLSEPAIRFMRLTTFGLLPPTIRADYGFPWSARHEAVLRLLAAFVRTLLPLTPPVLRYWPAARAAARAARGSGCPLHTRPGAVGHESFGSTPRQKHLDSPILPSFQPRSRNVLASKRDVSGRMSQLESNLDSAAACDSASEMAKPNSPSPPKAEIIPRPDLHKLSLPP